VPNGGEYRDYSFLFSRFLPDLLKRGFSEATLQSLMVENPKRVLTPRVRASDQAN